MQRNALEFQELFRKMLHASKNRKREATNLASAICNATQPLPVPLQAILDISPYVSIALSSACTPHTWVLPQVSSLDAYDSYKALSAANDEPACITLEASMGNVLAHVLHANGQFLSSCGYYETPITSSNNLSHLGERSAEAFLCYLHAKYVHCESSDKKAFLSLRHAWPVSTRL